MKRIGRLVTRPTYRITNCRLEMPSAVLVIRRR
jgi:hypothetical protein